MANIIFKEIDDMMKKDLTELIRAYEAFDRLNQLVIKLTDGHPIENSKFNEMLYVSDVIRRNSRYSADDDKSSNKYWEIIHDKEITVEEKYELLRKRRER